MDAQKNLLKQVKSKLDQLPSLYRDKVSEVMDPLIELCEQMIIRLDKVEKDFEVAVGEFGEAIDHG